LAAAPTKIPSQQVDQPFLSANMTDDDRIAFALQSEAQYTQDDHQQSIDQIATGSVTDKVLKSKTKKNLNVSIAEPETENVVVVNKQTIASEKYAAAVAEVKRLEDEASLKETDSIMPELEEMDGHRPLTEREIMWFIQSLQEVFTIVSFRDKLTDTRDTLYATFVTAFKDTILQADGRSYDEETLRNNIADYVLQLDNDPSSDIAYMKRGDESIQDLAQGLRTNRIGDYNALVVIVECFLLDVTMFDPKLWDKDERALHYAVLQSETAPEQGRFRFHVLELENEFCLLVPLAQPHRSKKKTSIRSISFKAQDYADYENAMESFSLIEWNVHLCRKEGLFGKGIFNITVLQKDVCVAQYWGNLVDDDGNVKISCPYTESLLNALPSAKLSFSLGHCAKVLGTRENLMVDGSHHRCSDFDMLKNRSNLPWGACLNSSYNSGFSANCRTVWVLSPKFKDHRRVGHNKTITGCPYQQSDYVGFIFTKRVINADEELLWAYNSDQPYRRDPAPESQDHPSSQKRKKVVVPHNCPHHTSCVVGKCWECICDVCKASHVSGRRVRKHRKF
jgi:hypothetical protein